MAQARELGITTSRAAENGVARAIKAEQERVWRFENDDAIRQANDYIERHGLPLAKYRQF